MFQEKTLVNKAKLIFAFKVLCCVSVFVFFDSFRCYPTVQEIQNLVKCFSCVGLLIQNEFFLHIKKFEKLYSDVSAV